MPSFKRYDTAIDNDYGRAHRASRRASDARGRAMGNPRNAAGHTHAAKLARVAGRMYMRISKQYGDPVYSKGADDLFAQAIFHDRYARKVAAGHMGAPGSHDDMRRLVRHRKPKAARDPRARTRRAARKRLARKASTSRARRLSR